MPGKLGDTRKMYIALFLVVVMLGCKFYFPTTKDQITVVKTSSSLERGKNLTYNICGGCHYDHKVEKFIGNKLNDLPRIGGELVSANLTNSKTHGVPPKYTDSELFYLLKTGIGRNGRFMPYMMRPMMADEDVNDIIVFLRSDDPALMAADTSVGRTFINLVGKAGIRLLAKPQPYNKNVKRVDENDPVAYGRYLVSIVGCYHCHSTKAKKLNYLEADKTQGYLQGGMKLKDPKGKKIYTPNLTPDKETGIGNFTRDQFSKAIREGESPSGPLSPPMPQFRHLTDQQVDALYAYLQSLPPINHKIRGR